MPRDKLIDLLLMHLRDLWAVDGLYYLGIEKKFGTEEATAIDAEVWSVMGKLQARRLKETLDITGTDLPAMISALKHTDWWLDLENKELDEEPERVVLSNRLCRVQTTRLKKGLGEFGCKPVRWGFLKSFAKEFNPDIEVNCVVCPLDEHPDDLWCAWEFTQR